MLLFSTDLNQFLSKTLLGRAKTFCVENEINISEYLFRDAYTNNIKLSLKKKTVVRPGSEFLMVILTVFVVYFQMNITMIDLL